MEIVQLGAVRVTVAGARALLISFELPLSPMMLFGIGIERATSWRCSALMTAIRAKKHPGNAALRGVGQHLCGRRDRRQIAF